MSEQIDVDKYINEIKRLRAQKGGGNGSHESGNGVAAGPQRDG
jgi:hypothetical protein